MINTIHVFMCVNSPMKMIWKYAWVRNGLWKCLRMGRCLKLQFSRWGPFNNYQIFPQLLFCLNFTKCEYSSQMMDLFTHRSLWQRRMSSLMLALKSQVNVTLCVCQFKDIVMNLIKVITTNSQQPLLMVCHHLQKLRRTHNSLTETARRILQQMQR